MNAPPRARERRRHRCGSRLRLRTSVLSIVLHTYHNAVGAILSIGKLFHALLCMAGAIGHLMQMFTLTNRADIVTVVRITMFMHMFAVVSTPVTLKSMFLLTIRLFHPGVVLLVYLLRLRLRLRVRQR